MNAAIHSGASVVLGYRRRPKETRLVIAEGWFRTGDLGWRDADGYFYSEDRLKDMINVGGQKVYPAEVEDVIALTESYLQAKEDAKFNAAFGGL